MRKTMNLIEAISKLDARLMRDEQGYEIKGAHWVNRNDVIELLLAAQAPKPSTGRDAGTQIADDILRRIALRYRNCEVHIYPDLPELTPVEGVLRCAQEEGFHLTSTIPEGKEERWHLNGNRIRGGRGEGS
jgi:hypothetical protein